MTGISEVENSRKEKKKNILNWQFKKSFLTQRIESAKQTDSMFQKELMKNKQHPKHILVKLPNSSVKKDIF